MRVMAAMADMFPTNVKKCQRQINIYMAGNIPAIAAITSSGSSSRPSPEGNSNHVNPGFVGLAKEALNKSPDLR